jgi:YgiT-type zinc finger domain-containing protein
MYCPGQMKKSTAPMSISRKGYHIHFDTIPAYVCSQCGAVYFEDVEVDQIQSALMALEKETQQLVS